MNTNRFITGIIQREGGYVNHPADKGGPTNFGITQMTLSEFRKRPVTAEDVRNMERSEAAAIYLERYVNPWRFAEAEGPLFEHLLDMGVNHGIGGASKILQRALGVEADGQIGPISIKAYRDIDKGELEIRLVAERAILFAQIVKANPSQSVFIEGWMRRVMSFLTGDA